MSISANGISAITIRTVLTLLLLNVMLMSIVCGAQIESPTGAHINVQASSTTVHVAEPVNITLTVTAPASAQVNFPDVPQQIGDFEVIDHRDRFDIPSAKNISERTWTRILTIESIVTGELQIPAMEVAVSTKEGQTMLVSNPLTIQVASVLKADSDPTQFRDIEPVVDVSVPSTASRQWIAWSALTAGILILSVGLVFWIRGRRSLITPNEWAKRELSLLDTSKDFASGNNEAFIRRLINILREYLGLQFGFQSNVQTSQELLNVLKSEQLISELHLSKAESLLKTAEEAKFAGLQLSREELSATLKDIRSLIEGIASANSSGIKQEGRK